MIKACRISARFLRLADIYKHKETLGGRSKMQYNH